MRDVRLLTVCAAVVEPAVAAVALPLHKSILSQIAVRMETPGTLVYCRDDIGGRTMTHLLA